MRNPVKVPTTIIITTSNSPKANYKASISRETNTTNTST
jgi:hypothetical protein